MSQSTSLMPTLEKGRSVQVFRRNWMMAEIEASAAQRLPEITHRVPAPRTEPP